MSFNQNPVTVYNLSGSQDMIHTRYAFTGQRFRDMLRLKWHWIKTLDHYKAAALIGGDRATWPGTTVSGSHVVGLAGMSPVKS